MLAVDPTVCRASLFRRGAARRHDSSRAAVSSCQKLLPSVSRHRLARWLALTKCMIFLSTTHLRLELLKMRPWGSTIGKKKKKIIKRLNTSIVPDVTSCLQSFHYTIGGLTPWLLGNLEEIINVLFYLATRTWSEKGQNNHRYNIKKRKYAYSQYSCQLDISGLWFVCVACCGSSMSCILCLKKKKKSGNFKLDVLEYVGAENQTKENS